MIKSVCAHNSCTGCGACINKCKENAIKINDAIKGYNAIINQRICIACDMCKKVCPINREVPLQEPIEWFEGWASEPSIREVGSSGGLATAIALAFVKKGGICCSCLFMNGRFSFGFADDAKSVKQFSGSKYVKSSTDNIFSQIKHYLNNGKEVLFIGLPCQVAGLKNSIDLCDENLYTIDLICHGTPSPKLLEMFLKENGYNLEKQGSILFREKNSYYVMTDGKRLKPQNVYDEYTISFLKGLNFTENCYSCRYAQIKRVSDITLGDSWGSNLPKEEQNKGISLVLCQNDKGKKLLENCDLTLMQVGKENAINNNKQLRCPTMYNPKRNKFFSYLKRNNKFSRAVAICFPSIFFRQWVKSILINIKAALK